MRARTPGRGCRGAVRSPVVKMQDLRQRCYAASGFLEAAGRIVEVTAKELLELVRHGKMRACDLPGFG